MVEKTGQELLAEAASEPTLDEFMRRDPADLSKEDMMVLIRHQREARAQFIKDQVKKDEKKQGVEEPDDAN